MKTSINFKAAKSDSEIHNFRKKSFDYIRKDLTHKNEYWMEQKIVDRLLKIEAFCKEKSGRKLQKNAMPVREAVVVIKENTTMQDLHNLSKKLEEELNIRIFQIAIHKDLNDYLQFKNNTEIEKKQQIEDNPKQEQEESEINQAHQTYRRKR